MSQYLLAIDQGTTSSRAILFSHSGDIIASGQHEFSQQYPSNGWVEHDPEEIWETTILACKDALKTANATAEDITSIGITNQRETTLVWEKLTGKTVYPAIVWQDRRTADYCNTLKKDGHESTINEKTGLLLDPYFSGTKIRWILDHTENAQTRAESGELLFGTVDCFLLWRLTGGQSHKTDATNASRTLLFNLEQQAWDTDLLALFNIPEAMLPAVEDSSANFGHTQAQLFGQAIPIGGIAGDQQAALIGQACFNKGDVKSTYGTGCFMIINTGDQCVRSNHKLLTTVAYRLNGKATYGIEGSIFIAGAAVQWLRDGLQIIEHAKDTTAHASAAGYTHGVYLVPAFAGLGAPHWNADARASLLGMTRDTGIKEIASATLQSVAYQTNDLIQAMESDSQTTISKLRIDGGMVANDWMVQSLADILDTVVMRPQVIETTALGVAFLAGLQSGVFTSTDQIQDIWQENRQFSPQIDRNTREQLLAGWQHALAQTMLPK